MIKKLALFLPVFALFFVNAAGAGSQIYKNNVLTAAHVTVPGTHAAIVPPRNAVLSETFKGFELPGDIGSIEIIERDGTSYSESEGTLTPEGLQSLRVSFIDKSPVNLNGQKAALIEGTAAADESVGVSLLVLGNDRMTVYIYGFYPAGNKAAASDMKNSLLSCIFNPARVKSASGGYTLSTSGTSLKFMDEVDSARYFTPDGKPFDSIADSALFTSTVTDDAAPAEARKSYAEAAMGKYMSAYEYAVLSSRSVNYGGLAGIETIAEFDAPDRRGRTWTGSPVSRTRKGKAYQALLFDDDEGKIYILSGVAVWDTDSWISQFARISSSFTKAK